jgi:uncharacterized protein YprB with RNaseH-like and TPR domain
MTTTKAGDVMFLDVVTTGSARQGADIVVVQAFLR